MTHLPNERAKDAADAVRGLAEAVGVPELVKPAAAEVGETLRRCVRVALAPIRATVWGAEQLEEFIFSTVTEKLEGVDPNNISTPPLTVAGPVIEALRFAHEDEALRDMYATLLATSMDSSTVGKAHPSFVEVIRQMTPDEARLLTNMATVTDRPFITIRRGVKDKMAFGTWDLEWPLATKYTELPGLARPELMQTYLKNLERLGLIDLVTDATLSEEGHYDDLRTWDPIKKIIDSLNADEAHFPIFVNGFIRFTPYGQMFVQACVLEHSAAVAPMPDDRLAPSPGESS